MNKAQMDDNVSDARGSEEIWNLPNILTMLRLALVPVFIILMFIPSTACRWGALAVFVVAAATDHFDGEIARKRGLITDFGKIWDPIADKALTLGAFIVLSITGLLGWWFTIIVGVRELGITWMRRRLLRRGIVVAANSGGKAKTVSQMFLIFLLVGPWTTWITAPAFATALHWVTVAFIAIAFVLTVWSGGVYVVEAAKIVRKRS
ncbi:CDP-diacylglycerol--glycerol-3-phosphate 3-phosphatidyltransferase [Gleimia hominis]|uniref:CDP-diacylglycerol--glycerol-3-phosphate 3-phosphatidyltransferase n=1 Tax=Gleimia hominis TaxID=595468 RepID=UPI000C7F9398|nr:CDP-diacylglycerol--glycerol-3-phosphate 3-phosphatidyltransferase [Gleimia hominis]WIK64933.1 CDP-diacylglycerol--glycerol-3-phosphate 3-phosphatidyltransferase [Gleimia hominis]